ncbi:hypothetical protein Bphy_6231 (plasmid) [Paraburkholderia phymatum STM815]|uniref:Uncharacterized protein n=1 Tax=Paraburkholderia phymatum (strain DSM 17167 / CIP 108236 / LMG 21445 / STM815) TaxID=391038 RepID=B2JWE7_PARP8|nr:hypothetical protein Bphy_6231 [Paraburkholderia phymatum STM815]
MSTWGLSQREKLACPFRPAMSHICCSETPALVERQYLSGQTHWLLLPAGFVVGRRLHVLSAVCAKRAGFPSAGKFEKERAGNDGVGH